LPKEERGSSNLVISVGYLVVAIIILVNYIGQKPEPQRSRLPQIVIPPESVNPEVEALQMKLEEERRKNKDMRKYLKEVQDIMGNSTVGGEINSALPEIVVDTEDVLKHGLPTVRNDIVSSSSKQNPFIPGKNPFLPFDHGKNHFVFKQTLLAPSGFGIRSDPKIPFLIKGHWIPTVVVEKKSANTNFSVGIK